MSDARERLHHARAEAPYWAYRAMAAAARGLPEPLARVAGDTAARAMAEAMGPRRRMVRRHLRRASGGTLRGFALERQVQRAFASYARYWVESFRLSTMSPADLDARMTPVGFDNLQVAFEAGNGVIIVTPHLGGWDFGGAWFASKGYKATVVVEPLEPPALFEWFASMRREMGLEIVPLGPSAGTTILRRVKEGGIVGLVCDRDLSGGGVPVTFFGEGTTMPSGPAVLALRTGAPILPAVVYFEGHEGHRGVIRPPIPVERTGSFRDDVARVMQAVAHEFEDLIRVDPAQWHLFQPNWPSDRE
jgi:KDO2-lipid IV(A) lauroyltransferase